MVNSGRWVLLATALTAAAPLSDLHRRGLVFDGHVHVINRQLHDGTDIGQLLRDGQFDLVRAREGGVDAFFFSLFIEEEYYGGRFETRQVLRLLDLAHRQIERNRDKIEIALNGRDLDRIVSNGKVAAVLDLEGGFDLDGDLGVLRTLYRLGLRSAQLPAHNWANNFADSCCAPPKWNGLNAHGQAVVKEMNRLGMVINVSHASDATIDQVLDISAHPVLATHHGLRSLNDIPRTMPDHLLRKLASKGGVIGFQIGNEFHNRRMFEWRTKQAGRAFWDTSHLPRSSNQSIYDIDKLVAPKHPMRGVPAPDELLMSVDDWVAVVDRAIQVAGEDHVALGSDFDGGPTLPRGMRDVRDLGLITAAMERRGYSETRIRKFLGLNLLRVFRQVTNSVR